MAELVTIENICNLKESDILSYRNNELYKEKGTLWTKIKSYVFSRLGITRFGDYRFVMACAKMADMLQRESHNYCAPSYAVTRRYMNRLEKAQRSFWGGVRFAARVVEGKLQEELRKRLSITFFKEGGAGWGGLTAALESPSSSQAAQLLQSIQCADSYDAFLGCRFGDNGITLMHTAASVRSPVLLGKLLRVLHDKGVDSNGVDNLGRTPLHIAAQQGNVEAIKILKDSLHVQTNIQDKDRCTALDYADERIKKLFAQRLELSVEQLLEKGLEGLTIHGERVEERQKELDIPPLPQDVDIKHDIEELLAHPAVDDSGWPPDFLVQDDIARKTKKELLQKIREMVANMEKGSVQDAYRRRLSSKAICDARAMYGHTFHALCQRGRIIDQMAEGSEKEKVAQQYSNDLRRFIQGLGCSFSHCSDRLLTDGYLGYSNYVLKQQRSLDDKDKEDLDKALDTILFAFRQQSFRNAIGGVVGDQATLERVASQEFNGEMGLRLPQIGERQESYGHIISAPQLQEVQNAFWGEHYTSDNMVDYVTARVEKEKLHPKIQEHFELTYPEFRAANLYDMDEEDLTKVVMKREAVQILLRDLGYLH